MSNEIKKDIIYNNRIKSQLTNIKYVLFLTALMWYNFFSLHNSTRNTSGTNFQFMNKGIKIRKVKKLVHGIKH